MMWNLMVIIPYLMVILWTLMVIFPGLVVIFSAIMYIGVSTMLAMWITMGFPYKMNIRHIMTKL